MVLQIFLSAGIFVKFILATLIFFSLISVIILLEKFLAIRNFWVGLRKSLLILEDSSSIEQIVNKLKLLKSNPSRNVLLGGLILVQEKDFDAIQRAKRSMKVVMDRELGGFERNLNLLASIASTATFVGLLGTVWGLMDSFKLLATVQKSSLQTLAPSMVEALFATALGLIVAIPSSVGYNILVGSLQKFERELEKIIEDFNQAFL